MPSEEPQELKGSRGDVRVVAVLVVFGSRDQTMTGGLIIRTQNQRTIAELHQGSHLEVMGMIVVHQKSSGGDATLGTGSGCASQHP